MYMAAFFEFAKNFYSAEGMDTPFGPPCSLPSGGSVFALVLKSWWRMLVICTCLKYSSRLCSTVVSTVTIYKKKPFEAYVAHKRSGTSDSLLAWGIAVRFYACTHMLWLAQRHKVDTSRIDKIDVKRPARTPIWTSLSGWFYCTRFKGNAFFRAEGHFWDEIHHLQAHYFRRSSHELLCWYVFSG